MQRWKERAGSAAPPPRDVAAALAALSDDDLLRLRALARLRARGLPGGVAWSDLLHEAVLRALEGTRRWPPGVPLLAFLAGIMRSLSDEHWRRRRREGPLTQPGAAAATGVDAASNADPERAYAALVARENGCAVCRWAGRDQQEQRRQSGLPCPPDLLLQHPQSLFLAVRAHRSAPVISRPSPSGRPMRSASRSARSPTTTV